MYPDPVSDTVRHQFTSVPVRRLSIEVVDGPDRGAVADGQIVTIGSADGNTLRLTDRAVSRFHLELRAERGGVALVDQGSTNGTFVGALRLERALIPAGTTVRVGDSQLRVSDGGTTEVELHAADAVGGVIGRSPAMRRLMAQVARAAHSDISVLVTGESGTGKELIARALHDLGPRQGRPFVTVDCGALPPTLIGSELFGHERGAFTGADRAHVGAFEAAHGGTLFLDELGELPPALQATLLGVLERRVVRRLGSRTDTPIDVRVVAATHRDLRAEVNAGTFRLDLYYRLAVVTLHAPPLRERPDDIPLLVEHFLRDAGWDQPVAALISPAAMQALTSLHLAGNVRELRNLVEAAVVMGEPALREPAPGEVASASPVDAAQAASLRADLALPYKDARAGLLDAFERAYLDALLARAGGNVSAAARLGRLTRSHLTELIARHRR